MLCQYDLYQEQKTDPRSEEQIFPLERSTENRISQRTAGSPLLSVQRNFWRTADLWARRRFEFEMKLRFERNPIRDYEEQGEKADPVQVHHGMTVLHVILKCSCSESGLGSQRRTGP